MVFQSFFLAELHRDPFHPRQFLLTISCHPLIISFRHYLAIVAVSSDDSEAAVVVAICINIKFLIKNAMRQEIKGII